MRQYKVKDLKKSLELADDEDIVCIERIEDNYFDNHGWTTETHDFYPDQPGLETVVFMEAFGVASLKKKKKFIIIAHY